MRRGRKRTPRLHRQEDEADLDLYHHGARLYMPQLGRFLLKI